MNFDFLTDSKNFFLGSTIGGAVAQPPLVGIGSTNLNAAQFGQVLSGSPGSSTNLLFGVLHNRWGFLGFLQALRNEGVTKSLAEPTMTTLSGRPASFLVGGEQAIPVPAGLGQVGVQFEEFGTRLNFVPIVLGNGKIHLEVEPEVSRLDAANGTVDRRHRVPGRVTSRVNTTVELEDGQTFVIGGLIQHDVTGDGPEDAGPGRPAVPGRRPSAASHTRRPKRKCVILVTPHLVDAEDCSQAPKCFLATKPAAPTILSYSWKESSKRRAARGKSSRTITTWRPTRTARRRTCSRAPARRAAAVTQAAAAPAAPAPIAAPAAAQAMPPATINLTPLRSSLRAGNDGPAGNGGPGGPGARSPGSPDGPGRPAGRGRSARTAGALRQRGPGGRQYARRRPALRRREDGPRPVCGEWDL